MDRCIITTAIYHYELTAWERVSLLRLFEKLGQYDISYVTFNNFNIAEFNKKNNLTLYPNSIKYFDNKWFDSIENYNSLYLNEIFYNSYIDDYEYMLVYQLDSYVLYNALEYFINKKYDWIGYPLVLNPLYRDTKGLFPKHIYYNGGFNLRNIKFCLESLKKINIIEEYRKSGFYDEDFIYSGIAQRFGKVPSYLDAMSFCIDDNLEYCITVNDMNMPFGLHHFREEDRYKLNVLKDYFNIIISV